MPPARPPPLVISDGPSIEAEELPPVSPCLGRRAGRLLAESLDAKQRDAQLPKRIMSTPAKLSEMWSQESAEPHAATAADAEKARAATMRQHRRSASHERSPLPAEWLAVLRNKSKMGQQPNESACSASFGATQLTPFIEGRLPAPPQPPLLTVSESMPAAFGATQAGPPPLRCASSAPAAVAASPCLGRRAGRLWAESLDAQQNDAGHPKRIMSTPGMLNEMRNAESAVPQAVATEACKTNRAATVRQHRRSASHGHERNPLPAEWRLEANPSQSAAFKALASAAEDCLDSASPQSTIDLRVSYEE